MCKSAGYLLLRLDGQTPTARRMELVERFNCRSSPECELIVHYMEIVSLLLNIDHVEGHFSYSKVTCSMLIGMILNDLEL